MRWESENIDISSFRDGVCLPLSKTKFRGAGLESNMITLPEMPNVKSKGVYMIFRVNYVKALKTQIFEKKDQDWELGFHGHQCIRG